MSLPYIDEYLRYRAEIIINGQVAAITYYGDNSHSVMQQCWQRLYLVWDNVENVRVTDLSTGKVYCDYGSKRF